MKNSSNIFNQPPNKLTQNNLEMIRATFERHCNNPLVRESISNKRFSLKIGCYGVHRNYKDCVERWLWLTFTFNHKMRKCLVGTYLDFDDKLGSDIFRRLFRWFRLWERRSLYDSERFTDTGADLDFVLWKSNRKKRKRISINKFHDILYRCMTLQRNVSLIEGQTVNGKSKTESITSLGFRGQHPVHLYHYQWNALYSNRLWWHAYFVRLS